MTSTKLAFCLVILISVASCTGTQTSNEDTGRVIGGIIGGVLGAQVGNDGGDKQTAAIIAGTMIGSLVGGRIGRNMDEGDRARMASSLESNRSGTPSTWQNPDTGTEYTVVPVNSFESSGTPCREFTFEATPVNNPTEVMHGSACRDNYGNWHHQS